MSKEEQVADRVCPVEHAAKLDSWIRRLLQNPNRILGKYIRRGDRIIDLGCGPGFFTVELARLAGKSGEVIAVDLQPEMLALVRQKAERHGMTERITCHRSFPDRMALKKESRPVNFILAFYVIHETRNPRGFLEEIRDLLAPGGRVLLVEPWMHVSREKFRRLIDLVRETGYKTRGYPRIIGGRSVLLSA